MSDSLAVATARVNVKHGLLTSTTIVAALLAELDRANREGK